MDNEYNTRGFLQKGTMVHASIKLDVNAKKMNISDGPAKLRIAAWDHSWRDWWNGNQTYMEKEIIFDTKPPVVSILSNQHNVAMGGSGLVIYKLSEQCTQSGVFVGEDFFPGYSGYYEDNDIYLAFFAIPFDYNTKTDFFVKALDLAGNSTRNGFYHHIRNKKFKTDSINISDNFLNWKLPEFQADDGFPSDKSAEDKFIFINSELRKKNNHTILENGQKTENQILWKDAFGRLPNSARRANFADHRVYKYHGNVISNAVHMGIDLASVKHAEIPAANRGKVVFAGYVGIYGNLVCIDHGFGLMSIYAHLSRMVVNDGDLVAKGDIIGYTGTSGLAGGDHLHFGMFVDHVFVNPVEWWDSSWINNNIINKLETVQFMVQ
ncbi:MAG: M23 family metallopeptidase [Desulfobacteraceae bacterium]|nr:M23 family metallopeptidase [Desulfobacteraceae bacterium]MBC2757070.1 M23 family metallopeptidase [Desulfobacteraceae bacterium]